MCVCDTEEIYVDTKGFYLLKEIIARAMFGLEPPNTPPSHKNTELTLRRLLQSSVSDQIVRTPSKMVVFFVQIKVTQTSVIRLLDMNAT